jgi:capsular exopolysaccharide synthesis family protein
MTKQDRAPSFPNGDATDGALQLIDMTSLYDHFYVALWKLLLQADREGGGQNCAKENSQVRGGRETKEEKAKKAAYAIAFAGCRQGDGASTMSFNFASAFAANSSKSVLLVDGNLRDPILHHQFNVREKAGLADVVEGNTAIEDAITELTFRRYYFLQAGQHVMNPVSLYESPKFIAVMEKLRERYDLIIFDAPSVLGNPEAALLAGKMDGTVMVLRAEKTRMEVARSAKRDLEGANARILAAVINRQRHAIPEAIYGLLQ